MPTSSLPSGQQNAGISYTLIRLTCRYQDREIHGLQLPGFRIADQERLAARFRKLSKKGVQVMLSNSKVPEIEELYRDFHIEP